MASNIEGLVREGIAAFKAGRKDEARVLLSRATELDSRNEEAWLWLSAAVDDIENQQICLENVIALNPKNTRALQGLDLIQKERGGVGRQKAASPPPTPPPPAMAPPYDAGVPESQFFDDPDPSAPSLETESTGYYGSGGNVELPSGNEYDEWVDGLNLTTGGAGSDAAHIDPFGFDGPFQQAPDPDPDPFVLDESSSFVDEAVYSGNSLSPGYESGEVADDSYSEPQSSLYDGSGYETVGEEPVDEFSDLVEGDFSSAAPFGDDMVVNQDEAALLRYLEFIPPKIKATHLPGEGATYPLGLLAGVVLLAGGVLLTLLLLVGQLLL